MAEDLKPLQHLTVIYRVRPGDDARAILEAHEWSVSSWSHAVDERDAAQSRITELESEKQELALQALADNGQWIEHTGKQQERITELSAKVAELERERDEADRRAGAAERAATQLREEASKRAYWLREAKAQAGYNDRISFDVVWDETFARARACNEARAKVSELQALVEASRVALNFRPAYEPPAVKSHGILGASDGYLLLNPCDGFHIMWAHFDADDGAFTGFRTFAGTEDHGPEFYIAWAELPDTLSPELRAFDQRSREKGEPTC